MAANPEALDDTKSYRYELIENCLSMMGLEEYNSDLNPILGKYLSDEELSYFYDTFIQYVDDLDARGKSLFGKPFSAMTIEELDSIPISHFLPSEDIPFKLLLRHEHSLVTDYFLQTTDHWVGIARYEARRDVYLIEDILPPSSFKQRSLAEQFSLKERELNNLQIK